MYPALKKNIVIVKGHEASGIYNLNLGTFQRVSHDAGDFLYNNLNGQLHMIEFHQEVQDFITEAFKMDLIDFHPFKKLTNPTELDTVIKTNRTLKFAWIEISSICNQKCLHCFLGTNLNKYKHTSLSKIKEYIDTLDEFGVKQVVLSGGEPTLHPNIEEILDYAGKTRMNISLLTNGSSIKNLEITDALLRNDVTVKIPLLGWKTSHELIGGKSSNFRKTLKTIFHYSKKGVSLQLGTTINSLNIKDINKIKRFSNFMGIPLEISPIYKIGNAAENKDLLFQHRMREFINECKYTKNQKPPRYKVKQKTRTTVIQDSTDYESVDLKNFLTNTHECGQKIIAILSSGEVTPCLMIRDQKFSLGSTNNSSLKNILRSPSRSDFDQKMKIDNIPDCNGCEARYICKAGGCPATALAFKKSINVKNPLYSNCYYQNTETIADIENLKK